jgi:hypothetical protein
MGIKGIRAVRVNRGRVKMGEEGCEKIPVV